MLACPLYLTCLPDISKKRKVAPHYVRAADHTVIGLGQVLILVAQMVPLIANVEELRSFAGDYPRALRLRRLHRRSQPAAKARSVMQLKG